MIKKKIIYHFRLNQKTQCLIRPSHLTIVILTTIDACQTRTWIHIPVVEPASNLFWEFFYPDTPLKFAVHWSCLNHTSWPLHDSIFFVILLRFMPGFIFNDWPIIKTPEALLIVIICIFLQNLYSVTNFCKILYTVTNFCKILYTVTNFSKILYTGTK